MSESLLVALISGFCTLAGSCAGVLASSRLTQYRLAQLEKRVAQHNNLIERTYRLEGRMDEAEHGLQEIRGRMAAEKKGGTSFHPSSPMVIPASPTESTFPPATFAAALHP